MGNKESLIQGERSRSNREWEYVGAVWVNVAGDMVIVRNGKTVKIKNIFKETR